MTRELRRAAEGGNLELVKQCVEAGADVNSLNVAYTPLICGSFNGHYPIVKYLLEKEADVNLRNRSGASALIYACATNRQAIASLLLDYDADPSFVSHHGDSAESCALRNGWNFGQMKIQSYYRRSLLYFDHLFCCAIEELRKKQIIERDGEGIDVKMEEEASSSFLQNLMKNVHLSDLFISEEVIPLLFGNMH